MPDPVITIPNQGGGLAGLGADAAGLGSIMDLLFGKSSTSTTNVGGSTTTTQNVVDQAAIDKTVKDMLEGDKATNGLAAIFTGEKASGGFGGSAAALLTSDLVSRIVGEVAKLTSSKVVTNSGQTNTTNNSTDGKAKEAIGTAAALAALKKALGSASAKQAPPNNKPSPGSGTGKKSENQDQASNLFGNLGDVANELDTSTEGPVQDAQSTLESLDSDLGGTPEITIGDIVPADGDYTGDEGSDLADDALYGDTGDDTGDTGDTGDNEGDGDGEDFGDPGDIGYEGEDDE